MKTKKEIKKLIKLIEKKEFISKKQSKADEREVKRLRGILLFLETNPSEEYLVRTRATLSDHKDKIIKGYTSWLRNTPGAKDLKSPKSAYNSEMRLKTVLKQIKNIDFILS